MSENISQFSAIELSDHIAKEFQVDDNVQGLVSVSKRGLARLCGTSHRSWGRSGSIISSPFYVWHDRHVSATKR